MEGTTGPLGEQQPEDEGFALTMLSKQCLKRSKNRERNSLEKGVTRVGMEQGYRCRAEKELCCCPLYGSGNATAEFVEDQAIFS